MDMEQENSNLLDIEEFDEEKMKAEAYRGNTYTPKQYKQTVKK